MTEGESRGGSGVRQRAAGAPLRVFINYRRGDSQSAAGRLYDALTARLGQDNVFMDVDSIEIGVDYVEVVERAVGQCDVMIALIGDKWLDIADGKGRRRLDSTSDLVRLEIEAALERGIRVIPTLVEGAEMPDMSELPEVLRPLCRRQALELSHSRWSFDVGQLAETLERIRHRLEASVTQAADALKPAGEPRLPGSIAGDDDRTVPAALGTVAAVSPAPADETVARDPLATTPAGAHVVHTDVPVEPSDTRPAGVDTVQAGLLPHEARDELAADRVSGAHGSRRRVWIAAGVVAGAAAAVVAGVLLVGGNSEPEKTKKKAAIVSPQPTAPSAPGRLEADVMSSTSARLVWRASTDDVGVVAYYISRNGAPVGNVSGTSFVDTGLRPGSRYVYALTAIDTAGNSSAGIRASVRTPAEIQLGRGVPLPKRPKAGQTFSVAFAVTVADRGKTTRIKSGSVRCRGQIAGKPIKATLQRVSPGKGIQCAWRVPADAYDKTLSSSIVVRSAGVTATETSTWRVEPKPRAASSGGTTSSSSSSGSSSGTTTTPSDEYAEIP